MEATSLMSANPLGLNLDFLFGRGFLWAKAEHLRDWISLDLLRMEIPDLSFPFDGRGGLGRFRNTRCLVREIEVSVSESGLRDLLAQAAASLDGFERLEIRLLQGAAHVSLKMRAMGMTTYLSFKVALIPPEPPRADEIHLSLYDYRAFGPMPYAPRLLAADLLTSLLDTPTLRPPGRGESFSVGVAGDILSMRPLKLLLLHLFPQAGWKLPNLAGVVLDGARIRPGQISLRATTRAESWYQPDPQGRELFDISATLEGSRALAAYEAKDLFGGADQTLFQGDLTRTLEQLMTLQDVYGPHPELVARILECLLADPTPGHLTEADVLCERVLKEEPETIEALIARPTIAALMKRPTKEILAHYDALAAELRRRQQIEDWVLCELTAAQWLAKTSEHDALSRLKGVLALAPRNMEVLLEVRALTARTGDWQGHEQVLKRLTGVCTERQALKQVYLDLAHLLMDRRSEVAEARIYLEKVLRLEPGEVEALDTLGSGYVLSGQPLRALKAFGSAARAAEGRENLDRAAALYFRAAKLWFNDLGNASEALLGCRRALELHTQESADVSPLDTLEYTLWLGTLSKERERWNDALRAQTEAIALIESILSAPSPPALDLALSSPLRHITPIEGFDLAAQLHKALRGMLIQAERDVAGLYVTRERPDAAEPHWSRVLELDPADEMATGHLETYYKQSGQPEQLIAFYKALISKAPTALRRQELQLKLATLYGELNMVEAATGELREVLRAQPTWHHAREELVRLLQDSGRFETLRDALHALLLNLHDPVPRRDTLLTLASLHIHQFDQPRQGIRPLAEALEIDPRSLVGLQRLADALRRMLQKEGPRAASPLQEGQLAASTLEQTLQRLVDLRQAPLDRAVTLEEIAALAHARGAQDVATEAMRRSKRLRDQGFEPIQMEEVEQRIDQVLGNTSADQGFTEVPTKPKIIVPSGLASGEDTASEEAENVLVMSGAEGTSAVDLGDFRAKMRGILKKPASLSAADPDRARIVEKLRGAQDQSDLPQEVEAARASRDHQRLSALLPRWIEALEAEGATTAQLARIWQELGELRYYELEETQSARAPLERAIELDPQGAGTQASVLNALESVYEEEGAIEARVALLEQRLLRSDSEDLSDTYRLLIAQIWWDEAQDEAHAIAALSPVFARDPKNESAHRLLAQIAQDRGRWSEAASHYEAVLSERSGGLDEVELERDLADLCLHRLEDPARAQRHYERVLDAAPADARALEGIKQSQAARGDWKGYLGSLARELKVLVAGLGPLDLSSPERLDIERIPQALRQAASGILSDAAHILEENMGVLATAHQAWGVVVRTWPEDVEALERRIALGRELGKWEEVADDLEAWSDLLIEQAERFDALHESALIRAQKLHQTERGAQVLAGAIAMVQDDLLGPGEKEGVDRARRELQAMRDKDQDV